MSSLIDTITGLTLLWPWALLLIPLPFALRRGKNQEPLHELAPRLPLFDTVQSLGIGSSKEAMAPALWRRIVLFLAWVALCVATARPTYMGEQVEIPLSGRDLMLAIDISPSMQELDLELNGTSATRLAVVKSVVSDFVKERNGDRVGLILFGSKPYIQAPLSFDLVTVNTLLQEAFLGMAGQATAIGDAIALGVKRLRQRPEQSRVLILLSDGANTAGDIPPDKAAQLAQQEKIKIYTVGVGADEMLKRSFFGSRRVNPSADLDEEMLKNIASLTGGQYYRARSSEELSQIYQEIDKLEVIEQESRSYRPSMSLTHWFVLASAILYSTQLLLRFVLAWIQTRRLFSGGAR